jgi:hypothetical protein
MDHSEDDINFLLRKAADEYSPKESASQWENILPKITQPDKRKEPVFWFQWTRKQPGALILIFGILAGWLIFKESHVTGKQESTVKKGSIVKQNATSNRNETTIKKGGITNSNSHAVPHQMKNSHRIVFQMTSSIAKTNVSATSDDLNRPAVAKKLFNPGKQSIAHKIRMDDLIVVKPSPLFDVHDAQKKDQLIKSRNINQMKGFYFGVSSAIDYSSVKSSSAPQAGYAAGAIVGFHFSNTIDFESGLIFNKRNYYSEGRYFNMEKVRDAMPSGMQVMSLNTTSSVIEFPLKVKYNFLRLAKSTVFVTSGMSSYLITFQRNNYHVSMNGLADQMMGMYHKNEFLLSAVMNMSVGYNYALSKNLGIRAEPFLKIPLKGMGIGNLPVTSAGIQLSITRKFY